MSQKSDNLTCAPSKEFKNGSCYSIETLKSFALLYNKFLQKNNLSNPLIKINDNKIDMVSQIYKSLRNNHQINGKSLKGSQLIILMASDNKKIYDLVFDIAANSLPPKGPEGEEEWLSTDHIDKKLMQYSALHKDFYFYGAIPIDCHELSFCSTYNMNFASKEKEGFKKVGLIPNLDKHNQSGSHWVAVYFDLNDKNPGTCYFYDPTGNTYPKNIEPLFEKFKKYCETKNIPYVLKVNPKKHQKDESECGVYSINFIVRLLNGESYESILDDGLTFKEINGCRLKYFDVPYKRNQKIHHKC